MFYFLINKNIFHVFLNNISQSHFTTEKLIKFTLIIN